ncbi:hypothetical protein BHE74_00010889 [Ensete ventricosum]|nr:hypothetical protein BHE74_00010889 [Ensete ventricosum]
MLETFIEGLKLEIRYEVKVRQPYTLRAAISFARLQEKWRNQDVWRTKTTPRLVAYKPPSTSNRPPQPKKLTREELRYRSAKEFCWHCDEHLSHDHRCKKGQLLLIEPTEEPKLKDVALKPKEKDIEEKLQPTAYTFHVSSDYANSQIMNVDGLIKHQPVTILTNTRSPNDLLNGKGKQLTLHEKQECKEKTTLGEAC